MGSFSIWHWLIVLLVIVLVFGTSKLKNVGKDLGGAAREQVFGNRGAHTCRLVYGTAGFRTDRSPTVEGQHDRGERQRSPGCRRMRADRHLAPAAKLDDDRPFRIERRSRVCVIDRCDRGCDAIIMRTDFHRDDSLARRRHARCDGQGRGNPRLLLKPNQTRRGEHERVVLACVELSQTRAEVSANGEKARAGEYARELRRATDAARTDARRGPEPRHKLLD